MRKPHTIFTVLVAIPILYLGVASAVFRFRNPTANDAACFREIVSVLKFERLEKYQGNP